MTKRTFDQYCPIAKSLEVVGERWSLLILRELFLGPRRYTDLRQALPGMWTNLLADRLRQLEEAGVIRRRELPPPAARTVYELTQRGRELEPILLGLGAWGFSLLTEAPQDVVPLSTAVLVGLRAFFRPEAAKQVDESYEFRLGGDRVRATVRGSHLDLKVEPPERVAATIIADPAALLDVRLGRLDLESAVARGLVSFEGPKAAVRRARRLFALN